MEFEEFIAMILVMITGMVVGILLGLSAAKENYRDQNFKALVIESNEGCDALRERLLEDL